jgi:hypothetical protein
VRVGAPLTRGVRGAAVRGGWGEAVYQRRRRLRLVAGLALNLVCVCVCVFACRRWFISRYGGVLQHLAHAR